MTDVAEVPIYVFTEWDVDEFDPGDGLPIIHPNGVFIGDATVLDDLALSAGRSMVELFYSTTRPPFAEDNPTYDRAFIRYDIGQALTADQQAQARSNIGISTFDAGYETGTWA